MLEYLVVCPLVFLAGFVDAVAGGGGLISLPAYMMAGLNPIDAIGTNKFSASCGTLTATMSYYRRDIFVGESSFLLFSLHLLVRGWVRVWLFW